MPHIVLSGCNTTRNLQVVDMHVQVTFSKEYYVTPKAEAMLDQLHHDLKAVMEKYFDQDYESEAYISNHSYNRNQPKE